MPPIDVCLCVYVWRVSVRSLALQLHKLSHELLESLTGTFYFSSSSFFLITCCVFVRVCRMTCEQLRFRKKGGRKKEKQVKREKE